MKRRPRLLDACCLKGGAAAVSLVIGVDPGGTTGLAAVEYTPEHGYRLVAHLGMPLAVDEVLPQVNAMRALTTSLTGPWWIAVEQFVVSRRAGRSSTAAAGQRARAIVGALEAAFPRRVKARTASAMKGWNAGGRRLEVAGLRPSQGLPHTRDAAGHALFFHVTCLGNPDPLSAVFENAELARRRG
jgi:hypothetical protein